MKHAYRLCAGLCLWLACNGAGQAPPGDAAAAPDGATSIDAAAADAAMELRTCQDVQAAYKALTEDPARQRCGGSGDCQVLSGQCGAALGPCFHALNRSVTQEMLNALGERYRQLNCVGMGPVCRCPPIPRAECQASACTLL